MDAAAVYPKKTIALLRCFDTAAGRETDDLVSLEAGSGRGSLVLCIPLHRHSCSRALWAHAAGPRVAALKTRRLYCHIAADTQHKRLPMWLAALTKLIPQ